MSLKRLLEQGRLKPHRTSKQEVVDLLALARRDIKDAQVEGLSADRRFATAYNAALQLAAILLHCRGYRTFGQGHHASIFLAMKDILGREHHSLADYFDSCRAKRNITDYEHAGEISSAEADELVGEAEKFYRTVCNWLKEKYPDLV